MNFVSFLFYCFSLWTTAHCLCKWSILWLIDWLRYIAKPPCRCCRLWWQRQRRQIRVAWVHGSASTRRSLSVVQRSAHAGHMLQTSPETPASSSYTPSASHRQSPWTFNNNKVKSHTANLALCPMLRRLQPHHLIFHQHLTVKDFEPSTTTKWCHIQQTSPYAPRSGDSSLIIL